MTRRSTEGARRAYTRLRTSPPSQWSWPPARQVLGTPTLDEIQSMNQNYTEYKFPQVKPHPWAKVFRPRTPTDAIDLVSGFLRYVRRTCAPRAPKARGALRAARARRFV